MIYSERLFLSANGFSKWNIFSEIYFKYKVLHVLMPSHTKINRYNWNRGLWVISLIYSRCSLHNLKYVDWWCSPLFCSAFPTSRHTNLSSMIDEFAFPVIPPKYAIYTNWLNWSLTTEYTNRWNINWKWKNYNN